MSSQCPLTWIYLSGTQTNQTNMHILPQISHTSPQQWQHLRSFDNKKRLTALHKFCKPGIKLSMFVKNISCLSIYSSYHIWLCRNDPVFVTPSYLPAPFQSSPSPWTLCIILFSWNSTTKSALSVVLVGYYHPWQPIIWVVPSWKPVYYQLQLK